MVSSPPSVRHRCRAPKEARTAEKHYFVNIEKKLGWLQSAGFKNVHTIWQYLFGYVVVGSK